jgi:Methyltransferase domain
MPFALGRLARRWSRSAGDGRPRDGGGPAPTPLSPPGSRRVTAGFFDRHPRFFETSDTSAQPWRLNLRYEAIFADHADLLKGARVLDIASHDGRWSLAALETGARSVVGIEAREDLVRAAEENLRLSGVDASAFDFVAGDVFDVLRDGAIEVDVVLCLGFLYHTLRYNELWTRIRECRPGHLLVDTSVRGSDARPVVHLSQEPTSRQGNAVEDAFSYGHQVLVGRPSLAALELMGEAHGFRLEGLADWGSLIRDNPEADGIGDYRAGRRVTAHFVSAEDPG